MILIVEDDPVLRCITQKQLLFLGLDSETVETGERAVERVSADIALILMDVGLPGIDGATAALQIREKELREQRRRVPIIALTAHADEQRCRNAGMDGFLQKPALLADLKALIEQWLPITKEETQS